MALAKMLVADPAPAVAQVVAHRCGRLADTQIVCTTPRQTASDVAQHKPELVIVAVQLLAGESNIAGWFRALRRANPEMLLIVSHGEPLNAADARTLRRAGVDELLPDPIDVERVYRLAAARWDVPLREQPRYRVALDVRRPDGVLIGRTVDLSAGGMAIEAMRPMPLDTSIVVDIGLPRSAPVRVKYSAHRITGGGAARIVARGPFTFTDAEAQARLARYLDSIPGQAAAVHACVGGPRTPPASKPTKLRTLNLPTRGQAGHVHARHVAPEK